MAVHPRVGGAHSISSSLVIWCVGSSPRGRGTLLSMVCLLSAGRFIPAWAGHTLFNDAAITWHPVHPRVGGAHAVASRPAINAAGSSPRGRGTPWSRRNDRTWNRFIPAWAGHTAGMGVVRAIGPVHPRVGGAHCEPRICCITTAGSSPRGRGTPALAGCKIDHCRFIPAWAGHTCFADACELLWTVHPRVGGAHPILPASLRTIRGSSPRGRGTLPASPPIAPIARFIPAWAGHTCNLHCCKWQCTVHPRVGGAHPTHAGWSCSDGGSSPRGRGTLGGSPTYMVSVRFIPAWAGHTFSYG